jgi:segregation and condensation protein A
MNFRVDLPAYRGPMDLLLYLVRRHELDLTTLSLAKVVEQFLSYLEVLQEIDVDAAGDFLDLASTLVELKSQAVLPRPEELESAESIVIDPQDSLVQRLLEYKRLRDASSVLNEMGQRWQTRYSRLSDDLPARQNKLGDQPISDLEMWDLVSAFGRILRENKGPTTAQVIQDDTPIHVHMQRIHLRVCNEESVLFNDLFQPGMHKTTLIGIFLAMLELTRHHGIRAEQDPESGDIRILKAANFTDQLQVHEVDNYDAAKMAASILPVQGR